MCDIYWARCQECNRKVCVHIGDFCTLRENVLVRCEKHPPVFSTLEWIKFTNCRDDIENYIEDWWGDWYMAIVNMDEVPEGYGIGEAGDIVPNCDWDGEENWICSSDS